MSDKWVVYHSDAWFPFYSVGRVGDKGFMPGDAIAISPKFDTEQDAINCYEDLTDQFFKLM